jgi:hypothetical protein
LPTYSENIALPQADLRGMLSMTQFRRLGG